MQNLASYILQKTQVAVNWLLQPGMDDKGADKREDSGQRRTVVIGLASQVRVEAALRENERKYRFLFEESPGISLMIGRDGLLQDVSKFALEEFGYLKDEVIGRHITEFLPPDKREAAVGELAKAFEGEGNPWGEVEILAKNGAIHNVLFSPTRLVVHEEDALPSILVTGVDICQRKHAEEALRVSEERFRTSAEHLPDCFGIYSAIRDASGRITDFNVEYVNRAASELARLAEAELLGKRLCELLPAYRESGLFESYCQVVETGVPLIEEFILMDLYGTEVCRRIFDIRVAKLGEGIVALWHEITDRVQAEEELRRTSSYLENLITFANTPIIVWNPEFKITRFNHAFEVLTGHRAVDVLAAPLEILFPEQTREEAITHIRRTMAGERWETLEIPILRRDGAVRDVLWNSANIFGEDGSSVIATIAQGQDITDRKRAEEQLKASLREKETLLRELHHRVKNNIQLVSSMLHLHAQYIREPTAFTFYKELQNRISSMALIHAKLYQAADLARIDFRNYLQDLTTALIHSYGFTAENVSVTLTAPEVLLNINTAVPLGLIINELVSNCLKHAFTGDRAGNEIRIELQPEADRGYLLKVSDNGVGFPAELDFRETKTLGLQLVGTLVEQLHGTIELERAAGTTFIMHFSERR